jgi:acyl-CoA synthetase (NDP forming)
MSQPAAALPKPDTATIAKLFTANSVALIGATPDLTKLGSSAIVAMRNLGFKGRIVAVNPRYNEMMGYPCVASVADLPDGIEAAMITVPAEAAIVALEECAKKGIKAIAFPPQGFGEAGEAGKPRDARVIEIARRYGLAICGPNTNGLANARSGLAMAIAPIYQYPGKVLPGDVAVLSQSGAMVSDILTKLGERGVGISRTVSCGNELLVTIADYLAVMAEDPETKTVVLFLETIRDVDALRTGLARCRAAGKPVVALKVGQSESGQKAALSHTGAIAGSYRNTVAFLEREGVLVADDVETLAAIAELVNRFSWPMKAPPRPFILAISGGFAALAADEMTRLGLRLDDPSPTAQAELRTLNQSLPVNPFDLAAQNPIIPKAADAFRRDGFNQLIFGLALLKPDIRVIVQKLILEAKATGFDQVYVVCPEVDREEMAFFNGHGVSVSGDTRPLFKAMAKLASWRGPSIEPTKASTTSFAGLLPKSAGLLDEAASKAILEKLGVATPRSRILAGEGDLAGLAGLKKPLAMKGLSDKIAHKTEYGLVALNLRMDGEIAEAYAKIRTALKKADPAAGQVLVEEMVPGGLEAIIGVQRDPVVGPVVVVGAGGILVELLDDAVVLKPPFTAEELEAALARTKFGKLLMGYRGKTFDRAGLVRAAVAIGDLAVAETRIESLDVNPLFVTADGVIAADAKLTLSAP